MRTKVNLRILLCCAFLAPANSCDIWYSPLQVYTMVLTDITDTEATSGGIMGSDRRSKAADRRGVCWSVNPSPLVIDSRTSDKPGGGSYKSSITGLQPNTIYYVRAYATNSGELAYGDPISFKTKPPLTPNERQLVFLIKMWRCTSATLNGTPVTGYTQFELSLSGTLPAFNFSATGLPTGLKSSPWMRSSTFTFGPDPFTQLVRGLDNQLITYTIKSVGPTVGYDGITRNTTMLELTFNYSGAGFDGRVGNVTGNWVYTFNDN